MYIQPFEKLSYCFLGSRTVSVCSYYFISFFVFVFYVFKLYFLKNLDLQKTYRVEQRVPL